MAKTVDIGGHGAFTKTDLGALKQMFDSDGWKVLAIWSDAYQTYLGKQSLKIDAEHRDRDRLSGGSETIDEFIKLPESVDESLNEIQDVVVEKK